MITQEKIDEAAAIFAKHLPSDKIFNREGIAWGFRRDCFHSVLGYFDALQAGNTSSKPTAAACH